MFKAKLIKKIFFLGIIYTILVSALKFYNTNMLYTCFITTDDEYVVREFNDLHFQKYKSYGIYIYNAKLILNDEEFDLLKKQYKDRILNYKLNCKKNKLDLIEIYIISGLISMFIFFELYLFRFK